jgi:hypothetical protein
MCCGYIPLPLVACVAVAGQHFYFCGGITELLALWKVTLVTLRFTTVLTKALHFILS